MVNEKTIITEFEDRKVFLEAVKENKSLLIVKFGATWCVPCKRTKPQVLDHFMDLPSNITCADVDVDDSFDVFAYLKSKKMVKGLPVILCYKKENNTFIPDDAVEGGNEKEIDEFFDRCKSYMT